MPNTVHDFLNHKTQERSGGFLEDWKDKGSLEFFLHTRNVPVAIWQHLMVSIVPKEDKQTREVLNHVWTRQYNCPESEKVLLGQYFRNGDGSRQRPPQVCGHCKLLEWTYQQLDAGKLDLGTPLFHFKGDVPDETTTIYAGGFIGAFRGDKLKPEEKKRLIAAGISMDWKATSKQASTAKPSYLVVLVVASKPADGPKITTITGGHGDKMKEAIQKEMDKISKPVQMRGGTKAEIIAAASARDPFAKPYMFEWRYSPDERPEKMYDVIAHVEVAPDEAVLEQITGPETDLGNLTQTMSQTSMRLRLERACVLSKKQQPPWDALFPNDGKPEAEADTGIEFPPAEEAPPAPPPGRTPEVSTQTAPPPPKKTPEELCAGIAPDDLWECAVCKKGSPGPEECVWCGTRYDDQGNVIKPEAPPPPPPPKQMRTRGAGDFKARF